MKNLQQFAVIAIIVTLFAISSSLAKAQQELTLEVGFSERLELPGPVANVIVGSSDIADVLPLTSNIYLLNAKRVGTTNIIAINDNAEQMFYTRLHVLPVDIRPNFRIGVTRGTGNTRTYNCTHHGGCKPSGLGVNGVGQPEDAEPAAEPALAPAEPPAEPAG